MGGEVSQHQNLIILLLNSSILIKGMDIVKKSGSIQ